MRNLKKTSKWTNKRETDSVIQRTNWGLTEQSGVGDRKRGEGDSAPNFQL